MPRYLLDTNILSFLAKSTSPALNHRFHTIEKTDLVLSSISEAEVRFGLALLPPEAKLHNITELFLHGIKIESWDSLCARRYALLAAQQRKKGASLSQLDTMIAAHALAHNFILITHDAAFARIPGLPVEDWTQGPKHP